MAQVSPASARAVYGILLAGGTGSRFAAQADGQDKLLASMHDGRVVLQASALALLSALPHVVAVVPPHRHARASLLRELGCTVVSAPESAAGLGASLAAAARHILSISPAAETDPAALGVVVALGDMPWVPPAVIAAVAQALAGHRAAAPVHEGQRGHPVGFGWDLLPALAALQGDVGARTVLACESVHEIAVHAPGVLRDVDLPADLAG